jgi:hypothetical protein
VEYGGPEVIAALLRDETIATAVGSGDFVDTVILRGGVDVSGNGLRLPWNCERRQCCLRIIGR